MNKRLTVSLPEQTVRLLHRLAGRGQRSSLVNRAVLRYGELKRETGANLRKRLAKSYAMNAALDRQLAEDWFTIDDEAFDRVGS